MLQVFFKDPHSPLESNDFLRMVIEQKHDVFGMEHPYVQGGLKTLHLRTPFCNTKDLANYAVVNSDSWLANPP